MTLPERSALAPGARADCSALSPLPPRGRSSGAPAPERLCKTCERTFDTSGPGRPFVRCSECRSRHETSGGHVRVRSLHRFDYIPPSGPIVIDTVAPGMYGQTDVRDWRESSACFGMDQRIFFGPEEDEDETDAERRLRLRVARGICGGCPVRSECLDFALAIGERYGIWGGLLPKERRRIRRRDA